MDNNSLCVNNASKIAAGSFIGLCAGTLAAPKRYSLKKLITLKRDVFEKTFNTSVTGHMNNDEKNALEYLKNARNEFNQSGKAVDKDLRTAAVNWRVKFNSIEPDPTLKQRLENKKSFLQKAVGESKITDINKRLKAAEKLFLEYPENNALKREIIDLTTQRNDVQRILKFPVREYREAFEAVTNDRIKRMNSLPNSGFEVKKVYNNMREFLAQKRTLMSNKLYELTTNPLMKESYSKIKSFLPASRIGNALKGAALFGTLTALGLVFFNPSNRT